jgi:tRNA pseudouridine32 synthase/23S rRNA pseudouridine746 synthase/23S rRNA pseudouridine1911/1915/1917 synthase
MADWDWAELRGSAVLFEDPAILALNKPGTISVMGERHETDIVTLAEAAGERLYPVHRIDKATTGLTLLAKDLRLHGDLTRQFNKRTVGKRYLLVAETGGLPADGTIDLPLTAGRKGAVRIATLREQIRWDDAGRKWWVAPEDHLPGKKLYPSVTRFATLWTDGDASVVVAEPVTGRRHQLRVHFAWVGHAISGDPLFDKAGAAAGKPTCLHSWRLAFGAAWRGGERMLLEAPAGEGFWSPVADRITPGEREKILDEARHRLD